MDATWTITELAEKAAATLAADGSARVNGRVRDLPNERLIRWYTTIGLVDPPLGRRGRTALYGHRHLLQLVAVKRRQSTGRTIAEIQIELTGATDATLQQIAALPNPPAAPAAPVAPVAPRSARPSRHPAATGRRVDEMAETTESAADPPPEPDGEAGAAGATGATGARASDADAEPAPPPSGQTSARSRDQGRFWTARSDIAHVPDVHVEVEPHPAARPSLVQGVRLAPDLTLLLDVPSLDGDDLSAIEGAARPLLDELRRRGLIAPTAEDPAPPSAFTSRRSP